VFILAVLIIPGRVVNNGMPDLDISITHPSIKGEVSITRDDWGVPHIQATHATDAYFAYGYAVAQDRLFQLEVLRRLGRGELSEVVGDATVSMDKISRTLMWRKSAEEMLKDESKFDPEFVAALDAFILGLNYFLETNPNPIEYRILGFEPKPFTKVDSLSLMGYMAYGFAEGIRSDSLYSILKTKLPDHDISLLFPGYSKDQPVTVMEGVGKAPEDAPLETARETTHRNLDGFEHIAAMFDTAHDGLGGFHGSNSWVLSPARSKSGGALLANDPHIGFTNPAVWYECHIQYDGYESYGVHLPILPFPVIAHNKDKAWSMTMFENDDVDLYYETLNPDDATQVMYKNEWTALDQWTETIKVKDQPDVELAVRVTPHGPLITDMLEGYEGAPVSLWWLFLDADHASAQSFYDLGLASNLEETRAAVSKLVAPGLNISYADKEGNIAWWAAAKIPIRPSHVNSLEILDGASGKDEVTGYLPFSKNPQLVNPERGVIVTSNNQSTLHPVGPIPELEGYWQPSDRAGRIEDLLAQQKTWSLDELKTVQTDHLLRSGNRVADAVVKAVSGKVSGDVYLGALEALKEWDYGHSTDSVGATVHRYIYDALLREILLDELGETNFATYDSVANSRNFVSYVVTDSDNVFWDNVETPEKESADEIILNAFEAGVNTMVDTLGTRPAGWQWGEVHTVTYPYMILGQSKALKAWWQIGPYPAPGTDEAVAKMSWRDDGYKVEHGASMRLLLDYSAYGTAQGMDFILPTGNSGHIRSPQYQNQATMYLNGEYRDIRVSDADIEGHAEHVTTIGAE
jgi:penicillin amidase